MDPNDHSRMWGPSAFAFGGDKEWFAIDRTGGTGHDHHDQAWSTAGSPTPANTFNRSIDAGASFQLPTAIPNTPRWDTLDLASDCTLDVVGSNGSNTPIYVSRSTNAKDAGMAPTFTTVSPNLGGGIRTGGGQTWSAPVRVNDDPAGNGAWQWFGTMSLSPGGRIEAVWNDTRAGTDSSKSALYYASSDDGGATWSPNEQASPVWDSRIGWPNQSQIGDYYHMISHEAGADLVWAATFNGEQDVYYLRIQNAVPASVRCRHGVVAPVSWAPGPDLG